MKKSKMRTVTVIMCSSLLFFFYGCGWQGFVYNEKVVGDYYLQATDIGEQMCLLYEENGVANMNSMVIPPTVFAVGHTDKYIIVKQHPAINKDYRKVTDYYIVKIFVTPVTLPDTIISGVKCYKKTIAPPDSNIIGPLTLERFTQKRKELNIPDSLKFDTEIKDLE
jgi:hypothetical protein